MDIKRNLENELLSWKSKHDRKPLILRGARQIGKSYTVREFGKKYFENVFEFNFERNIKLKKIFEEDLNPKRIINQLEFEIGKKISPELDLIFFDEIGECSEAIKALRYFYEEMPNYHICSAGSLLDFTLSKISIPVGRVQHLMMFPISFAEYLNARERADLLEQVPYLQYPLTKKSYNKSAGEYIYKYLKEYFILGGMPKVILKFLENESYMDAVAEQDLIIENFKMDIMKYTKGDLQVSNTQQLLENVMKHIGKQITYTTLVPEDSHKRTKNSLELLERAMLIHQVPTVNPNGLPLGAEASQKHFKVIFFDIGLLQRWSGVNVRDYLQSKNLLDIYEGKLAEQFVGQQLLSSSVEASEGKKLYCWIRPEKSSNAEIDYVIIRNGKIYPVEIKSGSGGKLKSMKIFLETFKNSEVGICLQNRMDQDLEKNIFYSPLYSVI